MSLELVKLLLSLNCVILHFQYLKIMILCIVFGAKALYNFSKKKHKNFIVQIKSTSNVL